LTVLADTFLQPDWDVPERVKAFVTTRQGGVSARPYDSLNLASHVGDSAQAVLENRSILKQALELPAEPLWLEQVHGIKVADRSCQAGCKADASYSRRPGFVCTVMTADCLPVFLASMHAGWKGMLQGVIEETVKKFSVAPEKIHAWLGPAIGPGNFEVGSEVRQAFIDEGRQNEAQHRAFRPVEHGADKYLADIYQLARIRLRRMGIEQVSGGEFCTVENREMFYSYRRDGITGRMASLIWIEQG
jgi:YfiH family protein